MVKEKISVSRRPIHPGELIRDDYMEEFHLSASRLAQRLGVSRQTVYEIVRENRSLSPSMCLRLARLFNTTPQFWINLQAKYDLWNAMEDQGDEIRSIKSIAMRQK